MQIMTRWEPVAIEDLELGLSARWQSDIENSGISQPAYAVFGVFASYSLTEKLDIGVNVENINDEKYLNSLQWDQAFYGSPRAVSFSLDWRL